jgi:integrase
MAKLDKPLTDKLARALPAPAKGYALYWCADNPGFGVRVTAEDARSWVFERRLNGATTRFTLGKAIGAGAITVKAAHDLAAIRGGEIALGVNHIEVQRAGRAAAKTAAKESALTLAVAVREYARKKRRGKDGLPLKERTQADYIAMIEASERGKPGELHELAGKPLASITGADMRRVYNSLLADRGPRRAVYAMQVLRATMNWHGVKVPDSPLGKDVAGKDRIILPKTSGNPRPIPREYLGAWWRAACAAGDKIGGTKETADYLRFKLLTGVRSAESKGDEYGNEGILVRDFDATAGRITMSDTKNRGEHVLLLSRQALKIAKAHAQGKKPSDPLFTVSDPRRTLDAINEAAGVTCTPHQLRHTFATIAADLVPAYTLQRMTNHAAADVTGAHYVGVGDDQLRAGWQAVADLIEKAAKTHTQRAKRRARS